MKAFYISLLIITGFGMSLKSETHNHIACLKVLEIKNKDLEPILDSIIRHEQQCVYYTPKIVFSIHFQKINDSIKNVQIGAIGSIVTEFDLDKSCFEFKGHLFLIKGNHDAIFKNTNRTKLVSYYIETEDIIFAYEDDTYSFWIYHYVGGNFFLEEMYDTYCKSLTPFQDG